VPWTNIPHITFPSHNAEGRRPRHNHQKFDMRRDTRHVRKLYISDKRIHSPKELQIADGKKDRFAFTLCLLEGFYSP
jgi:hypothetical protein